MLRVAYKTNGDGSTTARITDAAGNVVAVRSNRSCRALQLLVERDYLKPARYQAALAAERKER